MRATRWVITGILAFLFSGCANIQTAPTAETRQALAPTGKLRFGILLVPLYATKDPASGELTGIAPDLGRQFAQRLGVPFDPVTYANPPALVKPT
jgi:polar amino acid transport system substrate-binding protein